MINTLKVSRLSIIGLVAAVASLFVGCSHESLKGSNINYFGTEGRSNSYENYKDFINYKHFDESIKDSNNSGATVAPLPLSNQEFIFAATDGSISLIANQEVVWTNKLDKHNIIAAAMCADKEQNTYAVSNSGVIYSYAYDGTLRWKHNLKKDIGSNDIPCDLLMLDDALYTGISNGYIKKLSLDGKVQWERQLASDINKTISAYDNTLYFTLSSGENHNDTILALDANNGKEKWRKSMGIRIVKYPVTNGKNIVCSGLRYENAESISPIFYMDMNGKVLWQKEVYLVPRYLSLSENGELFINTFQSGLGEQVSRVYKFDSKGKCLWEKNFNFTIPTPVMISQTKLAFLGVNEVSLGLYFINKESGVIEGIMSYSNEKPIIHTPTVKPDGSIAFAYAQNWGFLTVDKSWFSKIIPW